jgi:hypothetical protein
MSEVPIQDFCKDLVFMQGGGNYRGARRNHRPGVATDLITKLNATPYFQHAISLSIWAQLRLRLQLLKR